MEIEQMLILLDEWVLEKKGKSLDFVEKEIIRLSWLDVDYADMNISNYSPNYVERRLAQGLWNLVSEVIGEGKKVTKKTSKLAMEEAIKKRSHPKAPGREMTLFDAAKEANNRGLKLKQAGQLIEARKNFELAIKINPDNAVTYYNQALMYEEAGKVDRAMELYQDAAFLGLAAAYCKLGRLYIIEYKDLRKSVEKIVLGLKLVKAEKVENDKIVKAGLLTYLGWAWKEQGCYEEALDNLQEAIKLRSDRGLTYGIMAQVYENLGNDAEVVKAWKHCLEYANSDEPDEDVYIGKARQRLKQLGGSN
ncbi:tetratricopeptide repeat protein [Microcoleus sp. herbarium12]|uniref:tetratricopeptide repeat protein n=1 Tax=Microcoleus sp. herbarium12 TaxID=3055437 RepID=UPI002FD766CA